MFIGEYQHSIDLKKRLAVPVKFRSELKNKVVVTRGLDKCLFVYPMKVWEELAGKLGTLPVGESATRSFIRLQLAGAVDVEVDKQGRILIPDFLKDYAGLDNKDVIIAGVYNRLEIWDEKKWVAYKKNAEKNTDEIAEQLGKLGVY
jgi:MraZ protein